MSFAPCPSGLSGQVWQGHKMCKRCSFECGMGKYSTRSMNKVWAFRRTPCLLNMCCIFTYRTKNEHRLYFLTRSTHTWHIQPYIVLNLQLECDMSWYWYTSHSENHSTECENSMSGAINPLSADSEYTRVFIIYYHIKYHILNMLKMKCNIKSVRFEKSWPPFFQICIIFTHLKLWIASARHNFKWVKIQIE